MHRIIFRADAGRDTGYGHFIRSLALADMLKEDYECMIYTQAPTEYQMREAEGVCPLVPLPADDSRFGLFLDCLKGDETVVLDNYFYTAEYQQAIRDKGCLLVMIDDIHDREFRADAIISPCLGDASAYDVRPGTPFCLGPRWALLRRPFLEKAAASGRRGCVVAFGGSDPLDLSSKFAGSLSGRTQVTILAGERWEGKVPDGVTVRRGLDAKGVAELLRSAEDVCCSASSICYEALACGARVHAGWYVDNQREFYGTLASKGLIDPLGDLKDGIAPLCGTAPATNMAFDGVRQRYRQFFRALSLRPVAYTDMSEEQSRKVWEARNAGDVRKWMSNPEEFSLESHMAFVESLRSRSDRMYFAFFDGGNFAGSCDLVDISGGRASRGLFVSSAYRGRGVAMAMETYIGCVAAGMGVHTLTAEVLKDNARSAAFHLKAGYVQSAGDDRYQYYTRSL